MRLLRKFDTPQTIIICEANIGDKKADIYVTDDESSFEIHSSNKVFIESLGSVYIFTEKEFEEYIESEHFINTYGENCENYEDWEFFSVVKDFVGEINLKVILSSGELHNIMYDKIDLNEYVLNQFGEDEYPDIIVQLPKGYEINKLNYNDALRFIERGESNRITNRFDEDDISRLYGEIESEGLGYWIQNYGYVGDKDPVLRKLCERAKSAMRLVKRRLIDLGVEV